MTSCDPESEGRDSDIFKGRA